ncbi:MAG: Ig-like domain repeat protein [Bryobacteraceae bacterium]|jgi:hypothetical protein
MTTAGVLTEFIVPSACSGLMGLTSGPDGAIWFSEENGKIGRLSNGVFFEYPVPTPSGQPEWITSGPDGALWFTEPIGNKIGRVTTSGIVTEYSPFSVFSLATFITLGPDGNLWFTETQANNIGKLTFPGSTPPVSIPTSVTLSSSLNPSALGVAVTFRATITPSTATGTVTFYDGTIPLPSQTIANGQAALTTSPEPAGTHSIKAVYNGDDTHSSSSAVLTQVVNNGPAPSNITLSSSANPSILGQTITLTATVAPAAATGTVIFYDGATALAIQPLVNGQSSTQTSPYPPESHSLKVTYSGDANFLPSTAALTQVVNPAPTPTSMTLGSSANPSILGQAVTLTAVVTPASVTGNVTFYDGATVLATQTVANGVASLTVNLAPLGPHSLKASYSGDPTDSPSNVMLTQMVNPVPTPTSITLSSSANTSLLGQPVTLTTVVTPATVTGSVTFYDGVTVLGTKPALSGLASFTTPQLPAGPHLLRAHYIGNLNFTPSTSAVVKELVSTVPQSGFEAPVNYAAGAFPQGVATGDFNGDGKADIAIANLNDGTISVLLGKGDGAFQPAASYAAGGYPKSIAVADFNGDGYQDLAVGGAEGSTVALLFGIGDGAFNPPVLVYAGGSDYVVAADFNGDGFVDLILSGAAGGGVLLGKGDGTFQNPVYYDFPPGEGAVGDFNGDGIPDFVVTDDYRSAIIYLGYGNGSFVGGTPYAAGMFPSAVALGDFNGDGRTDLAVIDSDGGAVNVLLGNGDGTFQAAVSYGPLGGNVSIAVGDFNGDGNADLAITEYDGPVSVLLGKGDGTFGPAVTYAAGANPSGVAVADLNGDGRTDLAVANSQGNNVSVLLGSAPGAVVSTVINFEYYENVPVGYGQVVTLVAQVFPSTATGTVTFNDGSTPLATVAISGGAATFNIASLSIGSHTLSATYNGDASDLSSSSASYSLSVPEGAPAISVTASPNPSTYGQIVTLTATIASSVGAGTITFKDGSTTLGTNALIAGTAAFSTATLAVGPHSLTAVYSGDSNDSGSTSPIYHQFVKQESREPPRRR